MYHIPNAFALSVLASEIVVLTELIEVGISEGYHLDVGDFVNVLN